MSGPQFVHLQTFSRKPNPAGQSTAQIFGELVRDPVYSQHLESPKPPELVDGIQSRQLIARHARMIEDAKIEVHVKGKIRHRAVRKDRHTLMTAVASYPLPWDQIKDNPEEMKALRNWEKRNIAFFRRLFKDQYLSTFRHTDEPFPHLHIYALPELVPGLDATALHPGKRAKAKAEEKARKEGLSAREAVAIGNKALKQNMRKFQDVYYTHVGEPCGLLRLGPKRQRLSRKDYMAQKHIARLRSASALEAQRMQQDKTGQELASTEQKILKQQSDLVNLGLRIQRKQADLCEREDRVSQASKAISICTKKLYDAVNKVGLILNMPVFTSIGEGLAKLEALADALHKEFSVDTEELGGDGPS